MLTSNCSRRKASPAWMSRCHIPTFACHNHGTLGLANMTALPPEVPLRVQHLGSVVSTYITCMRLEKILQQDVDMGQNVGNGLIYIRILGYLIHYVPTDEGLRTVTYEIDA